LESANYKGDSKVKEYDCSHLDNRDDPPSIELTKEGVKVTFSNGSYKVSQSVESILLFKIYERLAPKGVIGCPY